MVLAERMHALTDFATMVRRDEIPKKEHKPAKRASRSSNVENKAAIHQFRTADLLPPIDWTTGWA
jgi:hypothetical protein